MVNLLIEKIRNRNLIISVIGAGYVGLPTAALFAEVGFNVICVDVRLDIVKNINSGISSINEPGLSELISLNVKSGRLKATLSSDIVLKQADAILICVQTPIDNNKRPDLSFLLSALEKVGTELKKGMLIVVCSTIPPGTTQQKIAPLLESSSKLKVDTDFFLAFVPERIAPGKTLKEFVESPRLVGGMGKNSTKIANALFSAVCKKTIETDPITAEIAKTAENTFRDINIAFANQLALICEHYGADITKVIPLANTHPRVNIHLSGPGVGGPCLTKDPYLLINNICLPKDMITIARDINDYMPRHIIKLTLDALNLVGKNIANSKIGIIGAAYKAEVDDARFSPSEPVIQQLIKFGAKTIVYDPLCTTTFGAKKAESLIEIFKGSDCIIIMTEIAEIKSIVLSEMMLLMCSNPVIIDGKRVIDPKQAEKLGFIYYGVGYGKH